MSVAANLGRNIAQNTGSRSVKIAAFVAPPSGRAEHNEELP